MMPRGHATTALLAIALTTGCTEEGVECIAEVEIEGKPASYTFYLSDESLLKNRRENMETIAKAGACRAACVKVHPAGGGAASHESRNADLQACQDRCREKGDAEVECGKATRRKTVSIFGH